VRESVSERQDLGERRKEPLVRYTHGSARSFGYLLAANASSTRECPEDAMADGKKYRTWTGMSERERLRLRAALSPDRWQSTSGATTAVGLGNALRSTPGAIPNQRRRILARESLWAPAPAKEAQMVVFECTGLFSDK
jgi:hypothetical protein